MSRSARFLVVAGAVTVLGFGTHLAPDLLGRIPLFDVRTVELSGLVYLDSAEARALVRVPEGYSIWDDHDSLALELEAHPLVDQVQVRRRLPSRVLIEVAERRPVALAVGPVLRPVDDEGRFLPIDPADHRLDLPVLHLDDSSSTADSVRMARRRGLLATEVRRIEELDPAMAAALSDIRMDSWNDVVLTLSTPRVQLRYRPPISAVRLREAGIILEDALERASNRQLLAIDLRFAEQVVARYDTPPPR